MLRFKRSLVLAILVTAHVAAGSVAAQPADTYASLDKLPDLAGAWTPLGPPFVLPPPRPGAAPVAAPSPCELPPEYKPEVVARCRESLNEIRRRSA